MPGGKKRKKDKRLKWAVEYALAVIVYHLIRLAPFRVAMAAGGFLGTLAYRIDKRHRMVTEDNLRESLREKTPDEIARIARSVYRNLGWSAIEFIWSDRFDRRWVEENIDFPGFDYLLRKVGEGRGALYLTAHCGSWELMAISQAVMGNPFGVVVRPLDNPFLDRAVTRLRTRGGNTLINKNKGMREILRMLNNGKGVGILLDQNVSAKEGVFVDFFGRPACTNKGLALIAMKTKAPVIPAFIRRDKDGRRKIVMGKELPLVETGDKEADILVNTQSYTKAIEDFVREYPDQWFWMHRRWKTRPEGGRNA